MHFLEVKQGQRYTGKVSIANEKLGRSMLGTEKQLDLHT